MTKAVLWSDLMGSIPVDAKQELEHFLYFSELRTGEPKLTEQRLLETLSLTMSGRRCVN